MVHLKKDVHMSMAAGIAPLWTEDIGLLPISMRSRHGR